jgi:hypothetical protein
VLGGHAWRCQVQRLMHANGIQGRQASRQGVENHYPDPDARRRPDLVNRDFTASAPNELWVVDFSYLRRWEGVVFSASSSTSTAGRSPAGSSPATDALRMALSTRERVEAVRLTCGCASTRLCVASGAGANFGGSMSAWASVSYRVSALALLIPCAHLGLCTARHSLSNRLTTGAVLCDLQRGCPPRRHCALRIACRHDMGCRRPHRRLDIS